MKKFWIFAMAIVATMMVFAATPAKAKEPQTASATSCSEKNVWRDFVGEEVTTTNGNKICLTEEPDGFVIKLTADPEGLGEYEGVRCTDCTMYVHLDGMNNAVWDGFMHE